MTTASKINVDRYHRGNGNLINFYFLWVDRKMFAKVPILEVTKLSLYTCIESVVQAEIRNVTELKRVPKRLV